MICFIWGQGHFCLKNTFLLNWTKTPDPFLELCEKYKSYERSLFRDCKWVYCEHFGGIMSSPSRSVLEIGFCPNMDMGVAILNFFLINEVHTQLGPAISIRVEGNVRFGQILF